MSGIMTTHDYAAAMRRGRSMVERQTFGAYFRGGDSEAHPRPYAACAVGCVALGLGMDDGPQVDCDITEIVDRGRPCPSPRCHSRAGKNLIPHLNDDHRWSVERIADWLDTV